MESFRTSTPLPLTIPVQPQASSRVRFLFSIVLAASLGAVAGGAVTWSFAVRAPQAPPGMSADASSKRWIERIPSLSWKELPSAEQEDLQKAASQSTSLREAIVLRYVREADQDVRGDLRLFLGSMSAPDMGASALRLASSADVDERAAGLELLSMRPPSAEGYAIARRLLPSERDPRALAGAIMNLRPPELPSQTESREVVAQLLALGYQPDPMVRAHRMQMLAEWDKEGTVAIPEVLRGLSAPEVLVRQAAVGAVSVGELRSKALKVALVALLRRSGEDLETKSFALQALDRFSLTDEERTVCLTVQRELEQTAGQPQSREAQPIPN